MKNKKTQKRQKGFTLIEIIAVLIILGILAAVAIPKYMDLQKEAKKKAAQGLISAAQSALSMNYSKYLLQENGSPTQAWSDLTANATSICNNEVTKTGYDGYDISCSGNGNTITISVTTPDSESVTGTFTNPNS